MAKSPEQNKTVESLLAELLDPRNAAAWQIFLRRYGPLMMSVASQHALDSPEAEDCFIYMCEKLCEDDCRRLRSFDPSLGGSFSTWLIAIASNLGIDWRRTRYGRPGTPPGIQALAPLERLVFELSVLRGLDRESCLIGIRQRFPGATRSDLSNALAVVHSALSSQQRWKYSAFRQRGQIAPIEPDWHRGEVASETSPADKAAADEKRARLDKALSRLTARQRLILRLRYEQEMTLEEIAGVVGLDDLHQARRIIQAALRELSDLLKGVDFF